MRSTYAGVDWASEKHDVVIADETGERLLAATFAHDEAGVRGLCRALVRHEVTLVAIERPDGLLVERLLEAGLRILPLHPNQVAATRDRFRASGGKSDRFDAFVLCELARTDHHRFRVLEPDSDQTKALRALTRAREDLVGTRTALVNSCARSWRGSGPARSGCSRPCTVRSRSRSLSATPAPRTHAGWASSAFRRSWRASDIPAARSPRGFWRSFAALPRPGSASSSSASAERWS
jgi:transposase